MNWILTFIYWLQRWNSRTRSSMKHTRYSMLKSWKFNISSTKKQVRFFVSFLLETFAYFHLSLCRLISIATGYSSNRTQCALQTERSHCYNAVRSSPSVVCILVCILVRNYWTCWFRMVIVLPFCQMFPQPSLKFIWKRVVSGLQQEVEWDWSLMR